MESTEYRRGNNSGGEFTSGSHPPSPHEIRGWVRDLAVALSLALVIIVFLYQPVKVEGTSMAPLLCDQERIFINKFVYRFEPIGRGDVIVFWYPLDRSKSFIKRVMGLPGETIELRRGRLFIDGESNRRALRAAEIFSMGPATGRCRFRTEQLFRDGRSSR